MKILVQAEIDAGNFKTLVKALQETSLVNTLRNSILWCREIENQKNISKNGIIRKCIFLIRV